MTFHDRYGYYNQDQGSGMDEEEHDSLDHTGLTGIPTGLTGGNVSLAADVAMTSSGTDYDGPSVSLPAGTYLILWKALIAQNGSGRPSFWGRLWVGSTIVDEEEEGGDTVATYRYFLSGFVLTTLASTEVVKLTCRSDTAGHTIRRDGGVASDAHRFTSLTYVKIN